MDGTIGLKRKNLQKSGLIERESMIFQISDGGAVSTASLLNLSTNPKPDMDLRRDENNTTSPKQFITKNL